MKLITLDCGLYAKVDDSDYERVFNFGNWLSHNPNKQDVFYAVRKLNGTTIYLHNFILGVKGVDHKDRDGLNNQRDNLRLATCSQNAGNKVKGVGEYSSRYKGVFFRSAKNRWVAIIQPNGKQRVLGHFLSENDAAKAYNEGAKAFFGEFARINKILANDRVIGTESNTKLEDFV